MKDSETINIRFKLLTWYYSRIVTMMLALVLGACGGGGGGGNTQADTTPFTFVFTDKFDVEPNTLTTSNLVSIAGIDADADISVTDGEYSIDGAAFTDTTGTVSNGQLVVLRRTSSANFSTTTDATLNIGGVSDTFSVTTRAVNTTPDAFSFDDQIDVTLNSLITSNSIMVAGIDADATISITDGEYSVDGAAFTRAAGTVAAGQAVVVQHTSASFYTSMATAILTIGGVSDSFTSTTGPVGTGFNQTRGFNGEVTSIWHEFNGLLYTGDIYVGGGFNGYDGTASNGIIRLNSDGTVDNGFDVGTGFNGLVNGLYYSQVDSFYAFGTFTSYNGTASNRIVRLNSDGSVDSTFSVGSGFNDSVTSIAAAPDGSGDIYVAGAFTLYNGIASNRIIKLNSDGTVDSAFLVGIGFNDTVNTLSSVWNGSVVIYVGGTFTSYNGTPSNRVIRLNSDGTVDSAFSIGSGFNDAVTSISHYEIGIGNANLFIGGEFSSYNGTASNRIIKLNSDGTVDNTFAVGSGFNGTVTSISSVWSGIGDGDVDVYAGGSFTSYDGTNSNQLIRLNSDGSVDNDFAVGAGFNVSSDVSVISPATKGFITAPVNTVYFGGVFTSYNGTAHNNIVKLNSDGAADSDFFAVGSGASGPVYSIVPAVDLDWDIYVGGEFRSYNGITNNSIVRLESNGTLDIGFGDGTNRVATIFPSQDGTGNIYLGGRFISFDGEIRRNIVRVNSNGSVDHSFTIGSGFSESNPGSGLGVISGALDGSGDIYVGGHFSSYDGIDASNIIRLNNDGSIDNTFASFSSAFGSGFDSFGAYVQDISPALDGSGDIYVGGNFTSYNGLFRNHIIRLNNDATMDGAFSIGSGFTGHVNSVEPSIDGSGDIYIVGGFTGYNGVASNYIIRLNSDGSADNNFVVGSGFAGDGAVIVDCIIPATDGSGDVYVAGKFTSYNGTIANNIIRLNSDGTVDSAFATGEGFDDYVLDISIATDGSNDVLVGGDFKIYNSTPVDRLARLNPDGSLN